MERAVVVGAGPAGLGVAAMLKSSGVEPILLRGPTIADLRAMKGKRQLTMLRVLTPDRTTRPEESTKSP